MRLVFLGSGDFALPPLEYLHRSGLAPQLVVTQPDRQAGRGRKSSPPPIRKLAAALGLWVSQPPEIGALEAMAELRAIEPDFLVVADYGQILPPTVLSLPRLACINLHASLLPRWRGAAPVPRAILAGDRRTGITTIRMDARVDTGQILLQEEVLVGERETAGELEARLAERGGPLLEATLRAMAEGTLQPRPQPAGGSTRAPRLSVEEARLSWELTAVELDRRVRAYNPWPAAWTQLGSRRLKVWRARPAPGAGERSWQQGPQPAGGTPPGTLVHAAGATLRVACGEGALDLEEIQFAGGRRLRARDAINGRLLQAGGRLGA
ncbi:MAG: methionyl-tRNA formyltransferase [Acidobacteriota bacterium]